MGKAALMIAKASAYVALTGLVCGATIAQPLTHIPGLETERISPSPDAQPKVQRKDLPLPKDENNTRDVFLYLDGTFQGRVMHFRIPAEYVSLTGRPVSRHATSLAFSMLWPDLKSTTSPEAISAFHANKDRGLDEQIDISVGPKDLGSLTYSVSRLMAEMHYAKTEFPWIKYQDIEPVGGFSQGIRETNEKKVPGLHMEYSTKDYYIEWIIREQPTKFMTCHPYQPRPSCELSIYNDHPKSLFGLSIRFHYKYLPQLPEILRAVEQKVTGFMVATYPAQKSQ